MDTDTADRGPRDRSARRMMYHLFLLGFFAIFSTTISKSPVLPLFSQALGADDAVIGLIGFFSPFAGILFSFPMGVLSDHFGRRRLLVASGVVFAVAPVLYILIGSPVWLIPVRFLHGTATAILGPVVSAAIAERFPTQRGEMLGQYSSATLVGRTMAPLAGGSLISFFIAYPGLVQYQVVYAVAAVAGILALILTLLYREAGAAPLNVLPFSVFRESFITFFSNRRLRGTAFADMGIYFAFGAFETFLPLLLASRGVLAVETGIIFAVQVLLVAATKPIFGRLARPGRQTHPDRGRPPRHRGVHRPLPVCIVVPRLPRSQCRLRPRPGALDRGYERLRRRGRAERAHRGLDGRSLLDHGHRPLDRPPRHGGRHRGRGVRLGIPREHHPRTRRHAGLRRLGDRIPSPAREDDLAPRAAPRD